MSLPVEFIIDSLRYSRNIQLRESDAWMASDRGLNQEQTEELLAYRQALRDFPATVNPENIVWPEMPIWMA